MRNDFLYLKRRLHGHPLVYFDSAATTQKPRQVFEAMTTSASLHYGNVHRGIHTLSQEATAAYEGARATVADYIGAQTEEIIFTQNATAAINLVVWGSVAPIIKRSDNILLTVMEHHANIVPWQMLCQQKKCHLNYVGITPEGRLDLEDLQKKVTTLQPEIFSFTHASNVLGTINPVEQIVRLVRKLSPRTIIVVDGAQYVPHHQVNVSKLDCDFYALSAHKMLGPTGIGALYGKQALLEQMRPVFGGGDMIRSVTLNNFTLNDVPWRFEPGTPPITQAVGFAAAIGYLNKYGFKKITAHETLLKKHFLRGFHTLAKTVPITLYGADNAGDRTATFSFNIKGVHPHDLATLLDEYGIAIRSGHHCAQPLMQALGISSAARVSLYVYNTPQEIAYFFTTLAKVAKQLEVQ